MSIRKISNAGSGTSASGIGPPTGGLRYAAASPMIPSSRPLVSARRSVSTLEVLGACPLSGRVRRVEPDFVGAQPGQRVEHPRRAAAGVFVLMEPQPVVELGGLIVCAHNQERSTQKPRKSQRQSISSDLTRASKCCSACSANSALNVVTSLIGNVPRWIRRVRSALRRARAARSSFGAARAPPS